jgi:hypothetical protein
VEARAQVGHSSRSEAELQRPDLMAESTFRTGRKPRDRTYRNSVDRHTGPEQTTSQGVVVRGGSYAFFRRTPAAAFTLFSRHSRGSKEPVHGVGFRCAKSADDSSSVRALGTSPAGPVMLSVRTCSDACALLTLYAYDELTQHACEICSDYNNRAFCETGAFGDGGLVTGYGGATRRS